MWVSIVLVVLVGRSGLAEGERGVNFGSIGCYVLYLLGGYCRFMNKINGGRTGQLIDVNNT